MELQKKVEIVNIISKIQVLSEKPISMSLVPDEIQSADGVGK